MPNCVIFFDGINDSLDFIKSPLIHPVERSSDPEILFNARTNKKEKFNLWGSNKKYESSKDMFSWAGSDRFREDTTWTNYQHVQ